jgi:hypothetical protein
MLLSTTSPIGNPEVHELALYPLRPASKPELDRSDHVEAMSKFPPSYHGYNMDLIKATGAFEFNLIGQLLVVYECDRYEMSIMRDT